MKGELCSVEEDFQYPSIWGISKDTWIYLQVTKAKEQPNN
jgi:hypothetical protein